MKYPAHRRITVAKLKLFVEINEGLTAQMIAHCIGRSVGTVSSYLCKMSTSCFNEIERRHSQGMRGGISTAWRYYAKRPNWDETIDWQNRAEILKNELDRTKELLRRKR